MPAGAATPGDISTVAGNGSGGCAGDGSLATSADLNFPLGVAVDSSANLVIADADNNRVGIVAEDQRHLLRGRHDRGRHVHGGRPGRRLYWWLLG